ncbi:MAG: DUF6152 family protein [Pseudomonadota bacterium]
MKKENSLGSKLALLAIGLGLGGPVGAHHSFAMFDMNKTVTLQGVVRKVEYRNPHVYLFVEVGESTSAKVWAIEARSVALMNRAGWKINTIKPGDVVTVTARPIRDGTPAGLLSNVTLANGTVIK